MKAKCKAGPSKLLEIENSNKHVINRRDVNVAGTGLFNITSLERERGVGFFLKLIIIIDVILCYIYI